MTISLRQENIASQQGLVADRREICELERFSFSKPKPLGVFYEVYNELGHGFLESVYEVKKSMLVLTDNSLLIRVYPRKSAADLFRQ
jgi:hypothetical protein